LISRHIAVAWVVPMMKGMVKTDAMIIERTNIVYTSFKGSVSWTIKAFSLPSDAFIK